MEEIEVQITDLKNAYNDILSAINNLKDVEGLDAEYEQLNTIADAIDERGTDLEKELEELKEQQYIKEHEEEWKAEKRELENEYWNSQF